MYIHPPAHTFCVRVCVCVCVHVCVSMCVYVCVCVYVCMYIHHMWNRHVAYVCYCFVSFGLLLHFLSTPSLHCDTQRHTATYFPPPFSHCNTLQSTETHCNTLRNTLMHQHTLQHTAIHCETQLHTTIHCNILQHTAKYTATPFSFPLTRHIVYPATPCNTLQYPAMCCSTL